MADTREIALSGAWQAVADGGTQTVAIISASDDATWAVTAATDMVPVAGRVPAFTFDPPAFAGGHVVFSGGIAVPLQPGERLWARSRGGDGGTLYVTGGRLPDLEGTA